MATKSSTALALFGLPVFARHLQDASFVKDPRRLGQQQPCQPQGTDNSRNGAASRRQTHAQHELAEDFFHTQKKVKIVRAQRGSADRC